MNRPAMPQHRSKAAPPVPAFAARPPHAPPPCRTVPAPVRAAPFALMLALALAGCGESPAAPPLAGAEIGGAFTLIDGEGQQRRWSDFAGKYRIVYFGYTFCPDVCPVDAQVIGQALSAFETEAPERGARVVPIFITVDPERDTPQVVGEFARAFHPRMVGLTGSRAAIDQAAKAFAVYRNRGADSAGGGYLVDHSRTAMLFGPAGEPIAVLSTDRGAPAVAAELARWVR